MASEAKEETAVLDFERKYTEAMLMADGWWKRADMTRERYQKAEKLLNELRSKVPDDRPLQEKLAQCEQAMQEWDRYAKAIASPRPLH